MKMVTGVVALVLAAATFQTTRAEDSAALNFTMKNINGESVALGGYKGKVLLVVNVASKCGLTPQYKGIQGLYEKYGKDGFMVLGFPANEFGKQEPGTEDEIKAFCKKNYGVTFDMFSKVVVKGDDICPLYKYLTSLDAKPAGKGDISWNFEKFLIDRQGNVVGRYSPRTKPAKLVESIEKELAKK
jgi:glutathione peroxidase